MDDGTVMPRSAAITSTSTEAERAVPRGGPHWNPNDSNTWKIFSSNGTVSRIIETSSKKANWMRNVKPTTDVSMQNLIAFQVNNFFNSEIVHNSLFIINILDG